MHPVHLDQGRDRAGRRGPVQGQEQGRPRPGVVQQPDRHRRPTRAASSPSTASGPGIGSYTWRYVFEPTGAGTRVTESFDAEKPLGPAMTWLTEKWTGSGDRDADLHGGMSTTLARIKAAAEQGSKIGE